MKKIPIAIAFIVGVTLGFSLDRSEAEEVKPAYLVVSAKVKDDVALGPYREAASPMALAAGLKILARGDATLLEGRWDHYPTITLEKFDSMNALNDFWYSAEYAEAKKLREGLLDVDFIVAVEGS